MVWHNPTPAAEDNQSTGAAVATTRGAKDVVHANNSGATVKGGGFQLRRRPTPMPMTMAAAAAVAAVDGEGQDGIDPNTSTADSALDPIMLTRTISMKAAQSSNDYFSSLAARNIGGPGWNADNTNNTNTGDEPETRDQTNPENNNAGDSADDGDESYVHPFEHRGWDKLGENPWSGGRDRSVKTSRKDGKSSSSASSTYNNDSIISEDRDPAPTSSTQQQQQHRHLDLAGTMSSGGDSRDTFTALGSSSLDIADPDAAEYDSICSYALWCGGSSDADIIGPITVGRVVRDVKALLMNPLGSCDKIGRRRGAGSQGGADMDGRHGGSFAEDATISTWGSAEEQTINTYEEEDYSLASELSAEVGSGSRSVGSRKSALFTNFAAVRQRDRAPPMPTCNEEDAETADDNIDGSDELTLSNRRKTTKSLNLASPRPAGAPVAGAAGAIPLRRVMSDTSLSQYGHEVTVTQHRRQLSTDTPFPIASLPYVPQPSSPASPQSQVGASPTHVTSFENVIDLRTPKPIQRSKSFSKTETLKRRKEVEAKIRAEHRAAKAQRDKEKAIERAKLDLLRSKQERERRIAEAAEAEARRIEKEEARARKKEEIQQRKHEAELAVAREEQQREEERARKLEKKRLEAEAKAREAEERRNAQLAEAEQKRLDRETAKEQAKEQKLAAVAEKKAAAEEKKKAKAEKKAAKRAQKNKKKGASGDITLDEIQNTGDGANSNIEEEDSPATGSSIATPNADNVTRSDQVDVDIEKTRCSEVSADNAKVEGNDTSGTTGGASGGILDSIVPALGAATAAGALMFSDFVDSIADPVGINKEKHLNNKGDTTEESNEHPTGANHPPSSDPIAKLMSGFGFGDAVENEMRDQTFQRSNSPSSAFPEETNERAEAFNPSIPEASKIIESGQIFDVEATREAKSNEKDTLKKASVAALVTGAFARTRSISRSRDRERKLEKYEEERKANPGKSKAMDEMPANRGRSTPKANRRRSSSRGPPNKTAPNATVRPSEEEPPPSVVRNRAIVYQSFSDDPVGSLKMYKFISSIALPQASDDAFIKVQASTISFSDCLIRQGMWWGTGTVSLPATPGIDVVGRICNISAKASQKYDVRPGDYVAALIRCGGNARYVKASGSSLVKIPANVDPAAAACMVETYLSAFQSLHVGEPSNSRYSFNCFAGQNILVIGGISMVGQAMIELARLGGAAKVYATARQKHHKFLRNVGAIPLPIGLEEWLPTFSEHMDVVVDAYCIDHYNVTSNCLKQGGKLVCIRSRPLMEEQDLVWHVDANIDRTARFYGKMVCTYDIFESWEGNLRLCKVRRDFEIRWAKIYCVLLSIITALVITLLHHNIVLHWPNQNQIALRTILGICLTCSTQEKSSHRQQIASHSTRLPRLRNYLRQKEFRASLYANLG